MSASGVAAAVSDRSTIEVRGQLMIDGFVPLDNGNYAVALAELMQRHLQPA